MPSRARAARSYRCNGRLLASKSALMPLEKGPKIGAKWPRLSLSSARWLVVSYTLAGNWLACWLGRGEAADALGRRYGATPHRYAFIFASLWVSWAGHRPLWAYGRLRWPPGLVAAPVLGSSRPCEKLAACVQARPNASCLDQSIHRAGPSPLRHRLRFVSRLQSDESSSPGIWVFARALAAACRTRSVSWRTQACAAGREESLSR